MSTYTADQPSTTPVDPKVIKFYEQFYATSDDPSEPSHHKYADAFTKDATLIMGSRTVQGYDGILELRKANWSGPVKTRLHTVKRIFPWGEDSRQIMLFGNVRYGLKNGKEIHVEWAGRADLVDSEDGDGELKMKFYQVYLDSAPLANAAKE